MFITPPSASHFLCDMGECQSSLVTSAENAAKFQIYNFYVSRASWGHESENTS